MSIRIGVLGCLGRMGEEVIKEVLSDPAIELVSAVVRIGHPKVGLRICDGLNFGCESSVKVTDSVYDMVATSDVIIDFTNQEAMLGCLEVAKSLSKPVVSGTTGVERKFLDQYSCEVPLLWSANMSVGVNLLFSLVAKAAAALKNDYDVEIWEMHHGAKKDAPSGTALMLGEVAAKAKGIEFTVTEHGWGPRKKNAIGFAVSRGGGVVGDHSVIFVNSGERIELVHKAMDRKIFAQGAVKAAKWLVGKSAGLYTMEDVINE